MWASSNLIRGLVRFAFHTSATITSATSNNHKAGSLCGGTLLIGTAAQAAVLIDALPGKEAILTAGPRPVGGGFVARGVTTDGAALDLAPRVPVGERETVLIEARIVGRVTGAADTERLTYIRRGTYYRDAGGAITLQGSVQTGGTDTEVTGAADATLAIVGDWVAARVTGVTGKRIRWDSTFTVTRISEETHRTGITATGRLIESSFPPTPQQRHTNRHIRACSTMAPPPGPQTVEELVTADGRIAFPTIVQYQLKRWDETAQAYVPAELVDLPPTFETHPDEHAHDLARKAGQQPRPATLPYVAVVHDLDAYDRLKATGVLHSAHMTAPMDERTAVDNRAAPGA